MKFNDADLLGIPARITVSTRSLEKNSVELKRRTDKESQLLPVDNAAVKIEKIVRGKAEAV